MAELKCLDGYSGQSTDELIALEGIYRTDTLVMAFEQAVDQKVMKCEITDEEAVISIIEWLEREVNNGGYHLFFVNTKLEALCAVEALYQIGCPKAAEITQQAIDALGISGELTVEALDVIHEDDDDRDAKLSACDDRYDDEVGDLSEPLLEFIKANRDKITLPF